MNYFVTAIGTDSGKTLVSTILTEFLQADYWKPVQSGKPRDTETVASLIGNNRTKFHTESYFLNTPASPHASAKIDGVEIDLREINTPDTDNRHMVIEGAGGILVPLNDNDYVIDIAERIECELVLVANLYLGSINHTLLTVEYLKERGIPIKGLIFNGESNPESERIILQKSGYPCLLRIKQESEINADTIKKYVKELEKSWE